MTRHVHHYHALRSLSETQYSTDSLHGTAWCGERAHVTLSYVPEGEAWQGYSARMTNCPACSTAMGKAKLNSLGGRVELLKAPMTVGKYGSYYRSAWLVKVDGVDVGHVVMQNGWGKPWELKDLIDTDRIGTEFGSTVSHEPSRQHPVKADAIFQHAHCASKELMACAALKCRERGQYLMLPVERRAAAAQAQIERQREQAEREVQRAAYRAEDERKAALRAERKETALAGLWAALLRTDLTNVEIAGINAALDIINGKDVI